AAAQVERRSARGQIQHRRRPAPPDHVEAGGEEMVQQVVARRHPREHVADGPPRLVERDGGRLGHWESVPRLRSRRLRKLQRLRAAGPHLPYPSSPLGRGGNKEEALLVFLPSLPRGERGRGSEGRRREDAEAVVREGSETED